MTFEARMKELAPGLRQLLAALFLVVAVGLLWVVAIQPLRSLIQDRQAAIEIGAERLKRYATVGARREALEAWNEAGRGAGTARFLYNGTTPSLAVASLQGEVEALARQHGITIRNAGSLPEQSDGLVTRIGIRAGFSAAHKDLVAFLKALAESRKLLEVSEITISTPPSQPEYVEPELRVDMQIFGYMLEGGAS